MSTQTLFLAWRAKKDASQQWFPVGRLDIDQPDIDQPHYRFCYIRGAQRAKKEAGFPPVMGFSRWDKEYESPVLFPVFSNRVRAKGRRDRKEHLEHLDLKSDATPFEILSVSEGIRVTDSYEVFPKIKKEKDGSFKVRFFLHGWRHVNKSAERRIDKLESGERLYLTPELTDPASEQAVQIQTADHYIIGWTPRYLVDDLMAEGIEQFKTYVAKIVRVNSLGAPANHRVLIELTGNWNGHKPMSGADFEPLVKD